MSDETHEGEASPSEPRDFVELAAGGALSTDHALAAILPLFRQVEATHAQGRVAPLKGVADLKVQAGRLYFEAAQAKAPESARRRVDDIEAIASRALQLVGHRTYATDTSGNEDHETLEVIGPNDPVERPAHVVGYQSWEHLLGHHDPLTDHYSLGMLLASLVCGLDFADAPKLRSFAAGRRNLFLVFREVNPVVARCITRLTEPSRHRRAQELASVIRLLENYRDQDVDAGFDASQIKGFHAADPKGRGQLILSRLRERLFEISRRNRLLYFKPSLQTLNLTLASVPVLMDVKSVRAEQIFTWQPEVQKLLADGTAIPLARYLRFEDAPYLPSVLDKLIADARRDTNEFGFSRLRLVIAFLRWHNLKENREERIDSPLLLLPIELTKKKGVRDSYVLRGVSREAEVNPVVRQHLKDLFDIQLPHSIDLTETTIQSFYEFLQKQIEASEPGIVLNRLDRPQVELVHAKARRRLDQYRKRNRAAGFRFRDFKSLDYSYDTDNFQPLGLRLFLDVVRPSSAQLSDIFSQNRPVQQARMVAEATVPDASEKSKVFYSIAEGSSEHNPYSWDFDLCSLTLGNFNYRKMSLVRDYNTLIETGQTNEPFNGLFSLAPKPVAQEIPQPDLARRFPVVSCDPTQLKALELAATGRSYIIQGPPGTGKSQTITNLIADLVAQGKRVLFVCEKRAAIDVVYHRLRQRGLHELACLVHDSQSDKREFILELKKTYEALLKDGATSRAPAKRERCLSNLRRGIGPVEAFDQTMRGEVDGGGASVRRALLRVLALRDLVPELAADEIDDLPAYGLWAEHQATLDRLDTALRRAARDGVFASHPLASLSPFVAELDKPKGVIEARTQDALRALDRMEEAIRRSGLPESEGDRLDRLSALGAYAGIVEPLAAQDQLSLLQPDSELSRSLGSARAERARLAAAAEEAAAANRAWTNKLDRADLINAMDLARSIGNSITRFFKGDFWRLRSVLNARYGFASHAVAPTWDQVLSRLKAEYDASDALLKRETEWKAEFRTTLGVDALAEHIAAVRKSASAVFASGEGDPARIFGTRLREAISALLDLKVAADAFEAACKGVVVINPARSVRAVRAQIQGVSKALSALPDWMPCLAEFGALPEELRAVLSEQPLTLPEIEAALAAKAVEETWRRHRDASRFGGQALETQAALIHRTYGAWLEVNAEVVLQRNREAFREHVALAALPSVRLSKEQDEFKRRYNTGRRELEHEFGKSVRFKSVRALLASAAGEVMLDLKPVWLMSPLSVSDTLPIDKGVFDAVVFDEASQIPLEEAIPALFRADQVIVSGDQMQLPPTNFFSAARAADESVVLEDEETGEQTDYELDGNSLLTHAARTYESTLLGWHYRSRSESLISFSNAAFYDGELLTVPERTAMQGQREEIRAKASEAGFENARLLLDRPVSFHFMEDARYESRRNIAEASYVAQLVRGLLFSETRPSIGVVAFSEAQQGQIELALERLAAVDKEFGARLEEEYEREEDSQFSGLIVKNLENIQGDERDAIILSVCYGRGPDNRMLMNFGPINQSGGEKRLNVAFSRARKHMAVVSSIHHADITNVYNDGASALRNYLQYAAAMSIGDQRTAMAVLDSRERERRVPSDPVVNEVAAGLKARGLEVEVYVGQSHFQCHLAVRRRGETSHTLGVFVDTDDHYAQEDVLERDVLKPGLLRAFGWKVCHAFAKDWLDDREATLARIERSLDSDTVELPPEGDGDELAEGADDEAADTPATDESALKNFSEVTPGEKRYLEFVGGSSSKFWHVTVDGADLVVVFGRIGTDGQVSRKTYETPELARREAAKLIRQKLAKGYQETKG